MDLGMPNKDGFDASEEIIKIQKNGNKSIVALTSFHDKLSKDKFDLVLLDIIMPNKDGISTLSDILADKPKYGKMDVYMLTNIDSDITIQKAVEIGAKGYFLKSDLNPEQLVETVTKYIQ